MPTQSALFISSPTWVQQLQALPQPVPSAVQSWMFETHSLTQRLRAQFGNQVAVRILKQYWYKPFITESRLLGLPPHRYTLIREVLLHVQDTPLILARSIIPQQTIAVAHRNLAHLGTRPLGEVIFAYPNLQRRALELCTVPLDLWQNSCKQTCALPQSLWGRRTIYAIPTQPMLVSEFFMPELFRVADVKN